MVFIDMKGGEKNPSLGNSELDSSLNFYVSRCHATDIIMWRRFTNCKLDLAKMW